MGIKHPYTASSGELITSARWNADHNVTGLPTMQIITFLATADTESYDLTCATGGTWYSADRARVQIPGDLFLSFNRGDVSVHWKSDTTANIEIRIRNSGNTNTIAAGTQSATAGNYYTTLGEDLTMTFPGGNEDYLVEVKSDQDNTVISLYNVTTYFRLV